jgi:hypothetical protein
MFFPETHRLIVGNGQQRASGLLYSNLFFWVTKQRHVLVKHDSQRSRKHRIPNPFACLPLLADKGTLSVIVFSGITYAVRMTMQASLGTHCIQVYDLNYLQAGLVYLPAGIGGAIGAKLGGLFIDRTYKSLRDELSQRDENPLEFPMEKARLKGAYTMISLSILSTVGYGLTLMFKTVSANLHSIVFIHYFEDQIFT